MAGLVKGKDVPEPEKLPVNAIQQDMPDHYGINLADLIKKNVKDYSTDITITKLISPMSDDLAQINSSVENYVGVKPSRLFCQRVMKSSRRKKRRDIIP